MKPETKSNLSGTPQICILDKNKSYRHIIEDLIKALGYNCVESFESSREIIEHRFRPDILIMDYELGKSSLNGLEFFRLYGCNLFAGTKFIFFSSNASSDIAMTAIRLGAYDYILKSKRGLEKLASRLDKLVKIYRLNHRKAILLRGALLTLGVVSIILLLAIFFYSHP